MDLRVLQYFLAVAKEGNITRAADALHLTQPTLSRQLKELEEELGVVLFDRGNRKISLTDAGVLFQQRAAELVALLDKTRRELSEQEDLLGGVVSIGCVESKASLLLPGLLSAFHKEYPQVRYDLYSAIGDDIKEKLDRGVLDLGILIEPVEVAKYDYRRLPVRDRWGVVLTCGHPLAEKGEISLDQLARLPLNLPRREIVQEEISSWFAGQGPKLQALHYHSLLTNSLPLAQAGDAYPLCVEGAYTIRPTPGLTFVPIAPERAVGHVLAWKKNRLFSRATDRFIRSFMEYISGMEDADEEAS